MWATSHVQSDVSVAFNILRASELGAFKVIAHRPLHDVQLRRELSASVMFA